MGSSIKYGTPLTSIAPGIIQYTKLLEIIIECVRATPIKALGYNIRETIVTKFKRNIVRGPSFRI